MITMSETQKSYLKKVFTGIAIFAVVILMFVGIICENQIILGTICLAAFAALGAMIYYWICDAAYHWRLMGAVVANETYLFEEWKYTIYEGHIEAGLRETKLDMETGEISEAEGLKVIGFLERMDKVRKPKYWD